MPHPTRKSFVVLSVAIAAVLAVCTIANVALAQCDGGVCRLRPPVQQSVPVDDPIEAAIARAVETSAQFEGPSSNNAVRIHAGNGCGSGSVVGPNLIMTNAHVVGTRVGRKVTVRPKATGRDITGVVIMAAYSDRTLADWAVVRCDTGLESITPVPMSTRKPTGRHYTTGSPRCVWPLVSTPVITANISDNSPLWRWRPNSIGGQSGSGVWGVDDDVQDGLLTWSWGGLGAGQQTSEIFRQARERSVKNAPDRIPGLIEVIEPAPFCQGDHPIIKETGFFVQAGISDLPIWEGQTPEPEPQPENPDDPGRDCGLTIKERAVVAAMRDADPDDYDALVQIVIGILSLSSK